MDDDLAPRRGTKGPQFGRQYTGPRDHMREPAASDLGPTLGIDPIADLLFSLVAIVVLAVIIILPTVRAGGVTAPAPAFGEAIADAKFSLDGRAVQPFLATARGLRTGPMPDDFIPLDGILQDASLAARLRDMRERGTPLVLMIDPDGSEAAFQFEAVASADGPSRIRQVRLDRGCNHAKSTTLLRFCLAQANDGSRASR